MANIKTTPAEWAKARRLFESGLVLRAISQKTGIGESSLSRKAKSDGWLRAGSDPGPINKPDDGISKQVKTMAGLGLMDEEIAAVLGMKLDALRAAYGKELTMAGPQMVAQVAQSMFKMATDANKPNVTAAIFWLKCRGGWNDDPGSTKAGKKELRQEAAVKAAKGKFSAGAPPKLVVNNH